MSDQPRPHPFKFPQGYPPPYHNLTPEQIKGLQGNCPPNRIPVPPPPGMGMPGMPGGMPGGIQPGTIMNPRLYQHYASNLGNMRGGMPPYAPMWPYMPYGKPPNMPPPMPKKDVPLPNQET